MTAHSMTLRVELSDKCRVSIEDVYRGVGLALSSPIHGIPFNSIIVTDNRGLALKLRRKARLVLLIGDHQIDKSGIWTTGTRIEQIARTISDAL